MWFTSGMYFLLFTLFINDLTLCLHSFNIGITIGDEKMCIMLYSDDIVLLTEPAEELQVLLNALNEWCSMNDMHINASKSNVLHFRPKSIPSSYVEFRCGTEYIKTVAKYTYIEVVLHEHLDLNITVKAVSQSASRAL